MLPSELARADSDAELLADGVIVIDTEWDGEGEWDGVVESDTDAVTEAVTECDIDLVGDGKINVEHEKVIA